MKAKRVILGVVVASVMVVVIFWLNRQTTGPVHVGIIEPMAHVAISDITRGIEDGLKAESDLKYTSTIRNANGDASTIPQIIAQFKDMGVRIFVPIFTGTSQATKKSVGDNLIVFAAVTDPVAADLVRNPTAPEGNITGVSDLWPIGSQFDLVRQILPGASRVGILFDPNDPSSAATMPLIREQARAKGLEPIERPVHSAAEVAMALPLFKGQVDCLFTANDVTITKSFPALVAFAIENKLPLFAGDYSSVRRGAIAAVGQNYYNVGRDAAKLVAAIARGDKVVSLPVKYTQGGDLHVNLAAADRMGVKIPDAVRVAAKQTYDSISEGDGK